MLGNKSLFDFHGSRRELVALGSDDFHAAYYGHWMVDEKASQHIAQASFHRDLSSEFQFTAYSAGRDRLAWAAPRVYAKPTNCDVTLAARRLLYQFKR